MRKRLAMLVIVVAVLTGCGGGDVDGSALAAERWDPCSIPEDAIAATGLDPAYRDAGWGDGIEVSDWDLCTFRAFEADQSYFLSVLSSDVHTVEDARGNSANLNGLDTNLGSRVAFRYETSVSQAVVDCNIVAAASPGVVLFTVDFAGGIEPLSDPCELVLTHARDLESLLPPSSR